MRRSWDGAGRYIFIEIFVNPSAKCRTNHRLSLRVSSCYYQYFSDVLWLAIYEKFQDKVKFSCAKDLSFRLDNGKEILQNYFKEINIKHYIDSLEVTSTEDLLDYLNSYNNIPDNINQEIYTIINTEISKTGVKRINKESGIFICKK